MRRKKAKELSILNVNEKGQLCTVDNNKTGNTEFVYNKIGDCSNGMGICLGYNPIYTNKYLGW